MVRRASFILATTSITLMLPACSSTMLGLPKTPGEVASNYGYVPLDPLAIDQLEDADSCKELKENTRQFVPVLDALPDLAVRFAVADVDATGGLTFGPSKLTSEGGTYRAVLDYVNVDAVPVVFYVGQVIGSAGSTTSEIKGPNYRTRSDLGEYLIEWRVRVLGPGETQDADLSHLVTVPVYIGVGLRLSADIRSLKGNISLSGLGVIGAQAEASNLSGTLTVQTLGVNGAALAMALPLPNKLDQTTIEAGILAIGTSRAMLYTSGVSGTAGEKIVVTPRIVGLYSPIRSDPGFINAIYAELSRVRPQWLRPCRRITPNSDAASPPSPKPTFVIPAN